MTRAFPHAPSCTCIDPCGGADHGKQEIDPRAALPPLTPYYLMRAGQTALVPYYRPGDPAIERCAGSPASTPPYLLANHGPVVAGDTLEAAVFATKELEETAKLYLLLRGLNPRLSPFAGRISSRLSGLICRSPSEQSGRSRPPSRQLALASNAGVCPPERLRSARRLSRKRFSGCRRRPR